jgi:predicted aminopeptidase
MKPTHIALAFLAAGMLCQACCQPYVLKQGFYALWQRSAARSTSRLLADTTTPDSVRRLILLSDAVRSFAVDSLGLASGRNYTSLVTVPRSYLLDVVVACAADTFRPYLWHFPIVGSVPYKGYFERRDAEAEAARLRAKGLDVLVRPADAYSSLGLLRDPLYSFMARYSAQRLASLLLHEQTHATMYLKNQAEFSEQFAEFVAGEGSRRFLAGRYGDTSAEYRRMQDEERDAAAYRAWVGGLRESLEAVYAQPLPREVKLAAKDSVVAAKRAWLLSSRDSLFRTDAYRRGFERLVINNAFVVDHSTYERDPGPFEELLQRNKGDLRKTIAQVRELARKSRDPAGSVREAAERTD